MTRKPFWMGILCVLATIAAVVAGSPPSEINTADPKPMQGDTPMSTKPGNAKVTQAVQLLLAENPIVQQEAQEQILKERQNLVAQLSAIISDPDNHVHRRAAITKAMAILGESRARGAVKVLVTYIGFPYVKHPEAGEYPGPPVSGGVFNKTIEQLLPAVPALISIGEPCVDEVIKKLETTDGGYEAKACEAILKKLSQGPSVRSKLERALERNKTPKRIHLEKALKRLDEEVEATKK